MEIILWRHAEAEDAVHGSGASADAERALTKHGHKQARKMAAWLREHLPKSCRVIASPAVRAQQTVSALERPFDTSAALSTSASPKGVLKSAGWPDGDGTVLVVGHQPTLGRCAMIALFGKDEDWDLKKGAFLWIVQRNGGKSGGNSARESVLRAALTPELL